MSLIIPSDGECLLFFRTRTGAGGELGGDMFHIRIAEIYAKNMNRFRLCEIIHGRASKFQQQRL